MLILPKTSGYFHALNRRIRTSSNMYEVVMFADLEGKAVTRCPWHFERRTMRRAGYAGTFHSNL